MEIFDISYFVIAKIVTKSRCLFFLEARIPEEKAGRAIRGAELGDDVGVRRGVASVVLPWRDE